AVTTYGLAPGAEITLAGPPRAESAGQRLRIADPEAGPVELVLPLWGRHNAANALGVWAAARADGIPPEEVARALARFEGVRRRQELLGEPAGVAVLDDFAHHPTAVRCTLAGLRDRFPGRRLWALYEPRSLSAGRAFQLAAYREAFLEADRVVLAPIFHRGRLAPEERLDLPALAAELTAAGRPARACDSLDEVLEQVAREVEEGDVVVAMSSGSFGQMPRRLLARLAEREGARL
ncbi:MAG TPA: cyanophycin synthetase, partial [Thermoanaerobaculia bacterium]|nr:cyanophycin synthetase [Thermoanaerobaculia bacterium]